MSAILSAIRLCRRFTAQEPCERPAERLARCEEAEDQAEKQADEPGQSHRMGDPHREDVDRGEDCNGEEPSERDQLSMCPRGSAAHPSRLAGQPGPPALITEPLQAVYDVGGVGQGLGVVDERVEALGVPGRGLTEQVADLRSLGSGVLPPAALEVEGHRGANVEHPFMVPPTTEVQQGTALAGSSAVR